MQNIDLVYLLQPIITILFSVGIVVYWHYKRHPLKRAVLVYSLLAYAGAIAIKIALQAVTYSAFQASFGANPFALGAYFGFQTMIFEVGGVFLVAGWAASRGKLNAKDAEGYGLSLALWENAGFLGVLGFVGLIMIYAALALGGSAGESLSGLVSSRPDLFYSPTQALPIIGYSVLERVTSLLFHFSWGYLCLLVAVLHKKRYLLLALPMGLLDFLAPFANSLGIAIFEMSLFALGLGVLGMTMLATKDLRQ